MIFKEKEKWKCVYPIIDTHMGAMLSSLRPLLLRIQTCSGKGTTASWSEVFMFLIVFSTTTSFPPHTGLLSLALKVIWSKLLWFYWENPLSFQVTTLCAHCVAVVISREGESRTTSKPLCSNHEIKMHKSRKKKIGLSINKLSGNL